MKTMEKRAVDDVKEVRKARERREAVERERDATLEAFLEAEDAVEVSELEAAEAVSEGKEPGTGLEEARERLEKLRGDLRVAEHALKLSREREERVTQEAADELLESLRDEYADAVAELHGALHDAADANDEVRRIFEEASRIFGAGSPVGRSNPIPRLHRPELVRELGAVTGATRIGAWETWIQKEAPWIHEKLNGRRAEDGRVEE